MLRQLQLQLQLHHLVHRTRVAVSRPAWGLELSRWCLTATQLLDGEEVQLQLQLQHQSPRLMDRHRQSL